jgi:hypothetical protein
MRQSAQLDSNNRRCCDAFLSAMSTQLRSLPKSYMLKIPLQKSSRAAKAHRAPAGVKKTSRVNEQKQLYLVRKSPIGESSNGNGFRHHRPKEKRG